MLSDWSVCPNCSSSLVDTPEKAPEPVVAQRKDNSLAQAKTTPTYSPIGGTKINKNRVGQGLVVYGVIQLFILSFLFYAAPDLFYMWYINADTVSESIKLVIGGFASMGVDYGSGLSFNPMLGAPAFIFVAFIMIAGSILGLIGTGTRNRKFPLGGGLLLLLSTLIILGTIGGGLGLFRDLAEIVGLGGQNLLFGSLSDMSGTASWGIGIGTFIPLISGFAIMGGGALLESRPVSIRSYTDARQVGDNEFYLKNKPEDLFVPLKKEKNLTITIENLHQNSLRNVRVTLSGPSQVEILEDTKDHEAIASKTIRNTLFTVIPQESGVFTLTTSLEMEDMDSKSFSFEIKVE
ncbi:MAG: hypothetical protein ACW97V_19300 [Promethearchaeota archaeon]